MKKNYKSDILYQYCNKRYQFKITLYISDKTVIIDIIAWIDVFNESSLKKQNTVCSQLQATHSTLLLRYQ